MAVVKLTKSLIDQTGPEDRDLYLRDSKLVGLICKVTPAGRKIFSLEYRCPTTGRKRKPRIGEFGAITLDQARHMARRWMAEITQGHDPSIARQSTRRAPSVADVCQRFLNEYAAARSKPSYLKQQKRIVEKKIIPAFGHMKMADLSGKDVIALHNRMQDTPREANIVVAVLSKIVNEAVKWGLREPGVNPCSQVTKYRERRHERLFSRSEVQNIHQVLDEIERSASEHPSIILAIRLLFETGCRAGEIRTLRWDWIDWESRQIRWPDSKTGEMVKPLTTYTADLLEKASRASEFVLPAIGNLQEPLPYPTLKKAFYRILDRAHVENATMHTIRHWYVTDIANDSAISLSQGMALTGHTTAATFMRYVQKDEQLNLVVAERRSQIRRKLIEHIDADDNVTHLEERQANTRYN